MIRSALAFASGIAYGIPGVVIFVTLFWLGCCQNKIFIVMYRGLLLAGIAAVIHTLLLTFFLRRVPHREHVVLSAVSLALSLNIIFLVTFPVTIDRSVTVYLLGQLSSHPSGMTESELDERLIHQYVGEYRAVNRRMREQMMTGNVTLEGERFVLTQQGKNFMGFSAVVADVFGVDSRFIRSSNSNTYDAPRTLEDRGMPVSQNN